MPNENKKRGRRAEAQKRKREDADDADQGFDSPKRSRTSNAGQFEQDADYVPLKGNDPANDEQDDSYEQPDRPFYGLLDEDEQEYFKKADDMLEVNQFKDIEERSLFIENVHKEASGKELKLACSQSCSRLLERLMLLSTPEQLNSMFEKFKGQYLNLVRHRFASHCCETLFVRSAPAVTQELLSESIDTKPTSANDSLPSMEQSYLDVMQEMEGNIGFLMTDKFASHTLRVLLIILSGQPLGTHARRTLLQSKKKEKVDIHNFNKTSHQELPSRTVPDSFMQALEKVINESVSNLETTYVRSLATHTTANPLMQLLIQLELTHFGKQRAKDENSLIRKLLPDDPLTEDTDSASFVNGLLYDPVGSRLLEAIVDHAPGKMFKALYKQLFKDRIGNLARNEIAGYVVCHILERLNAEDLQAALEDILPQIPSLAERGRTNIMKTLAERCAIRKVDTAMLAQALQSAYPGNSRRLSIIQLLQLTEPGTTEQEPTPPDSQPSKPITSPQQNAASSLLQTMLRIPGPLSQLVFDSLPRLSVPMTHHLAIVPALSPILQIATTTPCAGLIFRRKMITRLYGTIANLSMSPAGSRLVDAVEVGSRNGLAFVRERVAAELAESEASLRNNYTGRKVWKNWRMDLYKRHRGEWVKTTRREVGNDGFQSFPGMLGECDVAAKEKGKDMGERIGEAFGEVSKEIQTAKRGFAGQVNGAIDSMSRVVVNGTGGGTFASQSHQKTSLELARERYSKTHQHMSGPGSTQSQAQSQAKRKPGEKSDWAKVVGVE